MVRRKQRKKIKEMTPAELEAAEDGIVIAWNFIRIRERLDLTQEAAAALAEVTVGYVGKVETAAVSFGTRAQQKWSKIFHVDRTEFLRKPEAGIPVIGDVMEKGAVHRRSQADREVEFVPVCPGYSRENPPAPGLYCLKVATDTLHPYLRRGSYLYVKSVPLSDIKDDNLIVFYDDGRLAAVKEVELLPDGRVLLKGLGRGSTITKEANELSTADKIIFIGL